MVEEEVVEVCNLIFEGIELGDGNNSGNGDDDDAPIITTDWLSLMGSGPGYE